MVHNTHNRFAIIPEWVIFSGISDGALRLYAVLARYADSQTGQAFPSRRRLASDINRSTDAVDRHVKELVDVGVLTVERRKKPGSRENHTNIYTIQPRAKNDTWPQVAAPVRLRGRMDAAVNDNHRTITTNSSCAVTGDDAHALHNQIGTDKATASALVDLVETVHNHSEPVSETSWETWNRVCQALDHTTNIDSADAIFNRRWDERLWELVAQSPGTRYGCARWIAQVVAYERSQWAA